MEKFPKGEMGWVSKSEVQDYIARNYVPKEVDDLHRKRLVEYEEALGYFLDDFMETYGDRELMRAAIKGGLSEEFIMREVLAERELYAEIYAELVAEGEILPDDPEGGE